MPPLDASFEDHATNAPLTVERTDAALDGLEDVLIVELLTARIVLSLEPEPPLLGAGTAALVERIDEVWQTLPPGADNQAFHAGLKARIGAAISGGWPADIGV